MSLIVRNYDFDIIRLKLTEGEHITFAHGDYRDTIDIDSGILGYQIIANVPYSANFYWVGYVFEKIRQNLMPYQRGNRKQRFPLYPLAYESEVIDEITEIIMNINENYNILEHEHYQPTDS